MDQMKTKTAKAIAVLISDIHYSLNTLKLADAVVAKALRTCITLNIPLIVAGDTHDSKANLRAECVNQMILRFKWAAEGEHGIKIFMLIGNHDKINEKSHEHSLNFLSPYVTLVNSAQFIIPGVSAVPYCHTSELFRENLKLIRKDHILIAHQGISGSNSGEYIQDKSAITPKDVAGFRVISGHYHTRQTIDLPEGGKWDYIGNPYSLNFAEANDPPKGFQILMDDGSLEFVPTNLRKHVVIEIELRDYPVDNNSFYLGEHPEAEDLVWVKAKGTKEALARHSKQTIGKFIGIDNFRLDLIPAGDSKALNELQKQRTQTELLDDLVDATNATDECKARLKQMWRDL